MMTEKNTFKFSICTMFSVKKGKFRYFLFRNVYMEITQSVQMSGHLS